MYNYTVCDDTSHSGVDIICDTDCDLVYYGVMYAYINAYAVEQLLFHTYNDSIVVIIDIHTMLFMIFV